MQKSEAKSLRLWGKIYGTVNDYYIAEGEKEAAATGTEPSPELEPRGQGVNKYAYWVTDSITGEWQELPDATPDAIKVSRQIKRLFTGNLDSEVVSNPFFKGKEKDLLRAHIARITQSTTLVPKGLYIKAEGNDKEIAEATAEEGKKLMPNFEQLVLLDYWSHLTPNILKVD
jgi:hypothetical protein